MRILITNDDGIHSEGLDVCAKIARVLSDDVWIVAPEFDQSGVAHSLTLNDPLRLRQVDERRFAVRGTPTDCVIMGVRHLLKDKVPDLVLSGVNRGRNAGEDVIYSGTIAGAMEGTVIGISSIALSQAYKSRSGQPPHWETSLRFGPDIIRKVLADTEPGSAEGMIDQRIFLSAVACAALVLVKETGVVMPVSVSPVVPSAFVTSACASAKNRLTRRPPPSGTFRPNRSIAWTPLVPS